MVKILMNAELDAPKSSRWGVVVFENDKERDDFITVCEASIEGKQLKTRTRAFKLTKKVWDFLEYS